MSCLLWLLSSDRFSTSIYIHFMETFFADYLSFCLPGYLSCKCVSPTGLDLKSMDGSRPGSRLPDSPAPPCSQQDIKIKQEPKTPIAPKKTQVCDETVMLLDTLQPHHTFVWFVCDISFHLNVFLTPSPRLLPGCEVKEHGFLGQPRSEVPVDAGLRRALLQRQLWTVQAGRQGEGGERETAESPGRAGEEGAGEASVGWRKTEKFVTGKEAETKGCNEWMNEWIY